MKIHSDETGLHIRLTPVEKDLLRALPKGMEPRTGHRREALRQMVAQEWPSPKEAADGTIGWFDQTMGANHWFSLSDVDPGRAAMLLCQHNPNSGTLEHAKQCTNDITGPQDLLRLLQRFEDLAKCKPQHRTLLQWLEFARRSKLRYHPWIDQYVEAAGLAADAPTAAEPVPVADEAPPLEDYSALATREQLIAAFGAFTGMSMAWFDSLAGTPALLKARKVPGSGQRGKTREPLFCPMEVVRWLLNPKRKKGRKFHNPEKPWELLQKKFPAVYAKNSAADPRA